MCLLLVTTERGWAVRDDEKMINRRVQLQKDFQTISLHNAHWSCVLTKINKHKYLATYRVRLLMLTHNMMLIRPFLPLYIYYTPLYLAGKESKGHVCETKSEQGGGREGDLLPPTWRAVTAWGLPSLFHIWVIPSLIAINPVLLERLDHLLSFKYTKEGGTSVISFLGGTTSIDNDPSELAFLPETSAAAAAAAASVL